MSATFPNRWGIAQRPSANGDYVFFVIQWRSVYQLSEFNRLTWCFLISRAVAWRWFPPLSVYTLLFHFSMDGEESREGGITRLFHSKSLDCCAGRMENSQVYTNSHWSGASLSINIYVFHNIWISRNYFVYVPSQWETVLQCNVVSHWLGACTEWSLITLLSSVLTHGDQHKSSAVKTNSLFHFMTRVIILSNEMYPVVYPMFSMKPHDHCYAWAQIGLPEMFVIWDLRCLQDSMN